MRRFYSMMLFLTLGMCLVMGAPAHGYDDLARDATVVAPVYHAVYHPTLINNGVSFETPYYWTSGDGTVNNTLAMELDWASAQTFDTVQVRFWAHDYVYNDANGDPRTYNLQKLVGGEWTTIATASGVTDSDNGAAQPFAQFYVPGGVSVDKIRVQNIFDTYEVAVWDRTGNIASLATVTASAIAEDPAYGPEKCVDNDFSTQYFPGLETDLNMANTEWMQFDWGAAAQVESVRAYFFAHPDLIEGKTVSLQNETSLGVWETVATATVGREDSGFYQCADFTLPAGSTFNKLRLENMFNLFEVDIKGSVVPEPSTLAMLAMSLIGLVAYAWRKHR